MPDPITCTSYPDFAAWRADAPARDAAWLRHDAHERDLLASQGAEFQLPAWCDVCGRQTDMRFAAPIDWREQGVCESCATSARMRFCFALMRQHLAGQSQPAVYLTEQLTSTYVAMRREFVHTQGSEYIPDRRTRWRLQRSLDRMCGRLPWCGPRLRHEDITALRFVDASFDLIGCFEVLEHVPDYARALGEFQRTLKPGGTLMLTAPFVQGAERTLTRARVHRDGRIEHLCEPEYHTGSTRDSRHLCYYHFGWDLLDTLRARGFVDPAWVSCWSARRALFAGINMIIARKPTA